MLEEVREIAVTLVVRQRCSPRRIHEHRERRHMEPSRHVANHGTKHRGREIEAASDRLREDDVGIGRLQRVGRGQEIGQPAAEAAAGHLLDGHDAARASAVSTSPCPDRWSPRRFAGRGRRAAELLRG